MYLIKTEVKFIFTLDMVEQDREPTNMNPQPNIQSRESAKIKLDENEGIHMKWSAAR